MVITPSVADADQSLFISDVLVPENVATTVGVLVGDLTGDAAGESIFSLLTTDDFVVINFNSAVGEQVNECSIESTQCFVLGPDDPGSGGMFRVFVGEDDGTPFSFSTARAVGVNLERFGFPGDFLLAPLFANIESASAIGESFLASDNNFTLAQDGAGFTLATDLAVDLGEDPNDFFARVPLVIDGITNAYTNEIIGRAGTDTPELLNVVTGGQIGFTLAVDDAIVAARASYVAAVDADPTLDDNVIDLATLEAAIESTVGPEIDDSDGLFDLANDTFGLPLEVTFDRPPL